MSTTAGQALEPRALNEGAGAFALSQAIEVSTGRDVIRVTEAYVGIPDAIKAQVFADATEWTRLINFQNPALSASCVRVNDEIQVATVVGQQFPKHALKTLSLAICAALPIPAPGSDDDAIAKQSEDDDDEGKEEDGQPAELHA